VIGKIIPKRGGKVCRVLSRFDLFEKCKSGDPENNILGIFWYRWDEI
jgi:hypothetical protein